MKRSSFLVREAVAAISAHGSAVDVSLAGTHYKFSWASNGRRRLVVISRSPGQGNARSACNESGGSS
jgi:hypothetical protein